MAKKKNLPAKPEENKKNNTGFIPTDQYMDALRENIEDARERTIFEDAYNFLAIRDRNNLQVIPHLQAYAKAFALYLKILEEAGDKFEVEGKSGIQINPLFLLADKQLARAQTLSKMLGLDNWSLDRVMQGEKPQAPEAKKTEAQLKKETFLEE